MMGMLFRMAVRDVQAAVIGEKIGAMYSVQKSAEAFCCASEVSAIFDHVCPRSSKKLTGQAHFFLRSTTRTMTSPPPARRYIIVFDCEAASVAWAWATVAPAPI